MVDNLTQFNSYFSPLFVFIKSQILPSSFHHIQQDQIQIGSSLGPQVKVGIRSQIPNQGWIVHHVFQVKSRVGSQIASRGLGGSQVRIGLDHVWISSFRSVFVLDYGFRILCQGWILCLDFWVQSSLFARVFETQVPSRVLSL